jgi:hypothetical protein
MGTDRSDEMDLPEADKDGYPNDFQRVADVLHEYVESGGGLFFTALPSGWNNIMPTINQFLQPWGAKCLDEQVVDPVTCGDARVFLDLNDWAADHASVEVPNPTDQLIGTRGATSATCGFLPVGKVEVRLEPGSSQVIQIGR